MKTLAYCAIHKDTNKFHTGANGQVAFSKIGNLKLSMHGRYSTPTWKDPDWYFYEIDSITKRLERVAK